MIFVTLENPWCSWWWQRRGGLPFFYVEVEGPTPTEVTLQEIDDQSCGITLLPSQVGHYLCSIYFRGELIQNGRFRFRVLPPPASEFALSHKFLAGSGDVRPTFEKIGNHGTHLGKFFKPKALCASATRIFVSDSLNHRIQVFPLPPSAPGNLPTHEGGSLNPAAAVPHPSLASFKPVLILGSEGEGPDEFHSPSGVCFQGNLLAVADSGNHRIQVFDERGKLVLSFGGPGQADGELSYPWGVAIDQQGSYLVADTNHNCIQVFDSQGKFRLRFGGFGKEEGKLNHPIGIACLSTGEIVVGDSGNKRIQLFDPQGNYLRMIDGKRSEEKAPAEEKGKGKRKSLEQAKPFKKASPGRTGPARAAAVRKKSIEGEKEKEKGKEKEVEGEGFGKLRQLAVDAEDRIIVADEEGGRIRIFDKEGKELGEILGLPFGQVPGKGPTGVGILPDGRVVVCSSSFHSLLIGG